MSRPLTFNEKLMFSCCNLITNYEFIFYVTFSRVYYTSLFTKHMVAITTKKTKTKTNTAKDYRQTQKSRRIWSEKLAIRSMTHATETVLKRIKATPFSGTAFRRRRFFVPYTSGIKTYDAENKRGSQQQTIEYAEAAAIITACIVAKGKLKSYKSSIIIFSHVHCTPLSGLEQNSVLIGAGIWYQTKLVADLHDTRGHTVAAWCSGYRRWLDQRS